MSRLNFSAFITLAKVKNINIAFPLSVNFFFFFFAHALELTNHFLLYILWSLRFANFMRLPLGQVILAKL